MMRRPACLFLALVVASPFATAAAQAWSYPSFQPPRVTPREFNFGVADASHAGTSWLFQWREGAGVANQLSLDAGIADPDSPRSDAVIFFGGQFAHQLATSSADMPLDFLFTFGAYLAVDNITLFRLPVGVSVGHRFPLEGGLAITPYIHPRISIDICNDCADNSDLSVSFDLGANFELTRSLALRASALFTGSNRYSSDGFGLSLAWTPQALVRSVRGPR